MTVLARFGFALLGKRRRAGSGGGSAGGQWNFSSANNSGHLIVLGWF